MIGGFKSGRGEFYDQEDMRGVTVLARVLYTDITPTSFRTENAWSLDGGTTWTVSRVDRFTRTSP
jgi:hypothetical protein